LGEDQLSWLKADLASLSASTPIVIFAHIPLWMVYPEWGWGTPDAAEALTYLKRFGSVTVLNGHIHQVVQKVEGNVSFHTACLDRISAACAWVGAACRAHGGSRGQAEERAGHYGSEVHVGRQPFGDYDSSLEE
jgi:3',5'-cyclic AMP phosphodiesterase CpdA